VILEINLQFRREIRNREEVSVKTWSTGAKGKLQTLRQVMINSRGEEACIADFTFGLFDTKARKLVAPTSEWLKAIGIEA
jgi:acyl-CoA thioester hydrolase